MFVPQALIVLLSGFLFYYDLFFAMMIQTWSFVIFNKVQTAQYWLWFMSLFPLTLINNEMTTIHGVGFTVLFIYGQCSWGYFANAFENEG